MKLNIKKYTFLLVFFASLLFSSFIIGVHDSILLDRLARYVSISDKDLKKLYNKASLVENENFASRTKFSYGRPIYTYYTELKCSLPHIDLGDLPTPINKLTKLGNKIGCKNLYIKRDDLTGKLIPEQGMRYFGGNKVRKLEFLLADALQMGVKTIMTIGGAGSNHALATTVCASILGFDRISILLSQRNNKIVLRNLLLGKYYGAQLHYFAQDEECSAGIVKLFYKIKEKDGIFPYYITFGGSSPLGAIGFVNAAFELKQQIDQGIIPEPDIIYVACGSMGTTAGLILGVKAAGLKTKVIPVRVGDSPCVSKILDLVKKTNKLLHEKDPNFPLFSFNLDDILFLDGFLGTGYAAPTQEGQEAIDLVKEFAGINLDPTYSGKAFAAVINHARNNVLKDKVVLFWDTFCGYAYDEITSQVEYTSLPQGLLSYFE